MDDRLKAVRKMWLVYGAHIFASLCYLYLLFVLNPSARRISLWVQLSLFAFATYSIIGGFFARKKYLADANAAVATDSSIALRRWRVGNFVGFSAATSLALVGFALRVVGSTWPMPGTLFGVALATLLLWRPRPLLQRIS